MILKNKNFLLLIFIFLFLLTYTFCIYVGSVDIHFFDVCSILMNKFFSHWDVSGLKQSDIIIIQNVRMPRVLVAAIVGASLSISGAVMQGLIKNPLADNSTLGISAGASLGACLMIALSLTVSHFEYFSTAIGGIIFSFLSLIIVISIAHRFDHNLSGNSVIITGIIFSMLTSSMMSYIIYLNPEKMKSIIFWTMGSFSGKGWQHVFLLLPIFIIVCIILLSFSKELDAFALGEEQASYLGINTKGTRMFIMFAVSVLVGLSTSTCGNIAFVGLCIPHIVRGVTGSKHKTLLISTIFVGSIFMMITDLISRTIVKPSELPVGIVTSFFGSLVFIYIYYKSTRHMARS